jgi:hypothetical protein
MKTKVVVLVVLQMVQASPVEYQHASPEGRHFDAGDVRKGFVYIYFRKMLYYKPATVK